MPRVLGGSQARGKLHLAADRQVALFTHTTPGRRSLGLSMSIEPTSCPKGTEEELKRFQGAWKQIAYERDGVVEPLDERGWEPSTTFSGEEFVVTLADGTIPIKGTYRIDPTRDPKTVDWTDSIGEDAGKTLLAIYSLQGDRLIFLCRGSRAGAANGVQDAAWAGPPNLPAPSANGKRRCGVLLGRAGEPAAAPDRRIDGD